MRTPVLAVGPGDRELGLNLSFSTYFLWREDSWVSLGFSFIICKMGLIIVLNHRVIVRIYYGHGYEISTV